MKYLIACLVLLVVFQATAFGNIVINEFMADNSATIADATDGSFDDWIEIYNSGPESVNLDGYFLTDDPAEPLQWAFPDTTIQPGEFFLIWADDDAVSRTAH